MRTLGHSTRSSSASAPACQRSGATQTTRGSVGWEGGYVGETYDTYDLITETGDPPLNHGELIADVVRALPQQAWAQRDFYRLRPDERMGSAWEEFAETVKHHRRYFFSDHGRDMEDPDYMAPGALVERSTTAPHHNTIIAVAAANDFERVRAVFG